MSNVKTKATYPQGGTGLETLGTAGQVLKVNTGATGLEWGVAAAGFGGNGSDGALDVTSGTTTIDAANATVVVKNYTSINISSGATLAVSNPGTNGTVLILRSQGACTIAGTINLSGIGASADTEGTGFNITMSSKGGVGAGGSGSAGGTGGVAGPIWSNLTTLTVPTTSLLWKKTHNMGCGSGGGTGGVGFRQAMNNVWPGGQGTGGRGGGCLLMEIGGALDFQATGIINISGANGTTPSGQATADYQDAAPGGGGGGGAGQALIMYTTLTANSGTVTAKGGAGGTGGNHTVSYAGYSSCAGGGGAGGGSYSNAGAAGGAGASGSVVAVAGTQGTLGAGSGGGGGGSCAYGSYGLPASGGVAPASSDTNLYRIIQNIYF